MSKTIPFKKVEEQISSDNSSDNSVLKLIKTVKNTQIFTGVNDDGNTLLHLCIGQGYIKSALWLIGKMDANDLAIKNQKYGNTPLHWAIDEKQTKIIQALLTKNGALASTANNSNETPLHWAAKFGLISTIELLLGQDADLITRTDQTGQTAIHWAAKHGRPKTTEYLLNYIKNTENSGLVELRDTKGQTALDLAIKKGFKNVTKVLNYHNNEKYFLTLDDSSDEEDTVDGYDISKKFKEFTDTNKQKAPFNDCNNFVLSFITHAAGVYLLYSPKVQKKYYELKLSLKIGSTELVTVEQIIPQFTSGIKKIHEHLQQAVEASSGSWKKTAQTTQKRYLDQKYEGQAEGYVYKNIIAIQKSTYSVDSLEDLLCTTLDSIDYHLDYPTILAGALFSPRKVLEGIDLSSATTNTDFFALLRLHNRVETRELKNREDGLEVHPSRKIKWGDKDIGESYTCQVKYCLKSEEVFYNGDTLSYTSIYSSTFQDQQRCQSYEEILFQHAIPTAKNIQAAADIETFYYHLFGCEAIKNPATFIHNKMGMDLIKAGKLTWKEALVKHKLPMTLKDAIMASRVINSSYNDFMPHNYLYDKDYAKLHYHPMTSEGYGDAANLLLKKEINITSKWLQWKLGESVSGYMMSKCCKVVKTSDGKKEKGSNVTTKYIVDSEAMHAIWGLILESCEEWYPDVLGDVA